MATRDPNNIVVSGILDLFRHLNRGGVRWCIWKSTGSLRLGLTGDGDIDILVDKAAADQFEGILAAHSFKRAEVDLSTFPAITHFIGLDEVTGVLIHLHVFYRLFTGDSLLKSYHLPLEELALRTASVVQGIPTVRPGVELVVLVLRVMLKHADIVEALLLYRDWQGVRRELSLAEDPECLAAARQLVDEEITFIDGKLFTDCVSALLCPASVWVRMALARRVARRLKRYRRLPPVQSFVLRWAKLAHAVCRRAAGVSSLARIPDHGGAVIAIVGPEATGKSTLVFQICGLLARKLDVLAIHAGKPPSSWITFLPNAILPTLRRWLPRKRSGTVESTARRMPEGGGGHPPLLYRLRCVWLAHDRLKLLARAFRAAEEGRIVLSDRYPSRQLQAVDSRQLSVAGNEATIGRTGSCLAAIEKALYDAIPLPDLVIRLTVPVDVAVARNAARIKAGNESEEYVRERHAAFQAVTYPGCVCCEIDTRQDLETTVRQAMWAIWRVL